MSFLTSVNRFAGAASKRSDVVIAAFVMTAVVMMVVPLPTVAVDILIGLNICFSLLVLAVAFYISRPVQFSALPAVILLSTLFRLSLSITTTRLILLNGNAGEIVNAFGEFVIAGQIVVGLVVFLVITIAQFLVITKGAERVAEVAARFTLDALPGKQMSIDNDLRNGDIDKDVARTRRRALERENQLYGAMDGAMKFVKGDAIAALIIIVVNLLGGLAIGMLQRGMPFSEATLTYSLLTVGDGLIAQLPALMVSLAAATVVTRVASDDELDLGSEVIAQLGADYRALFLAAAIMFALGMLPGFPTAVFFVISALLGAFAFMLRRSQAPAVSQPLAAPSDQVAAPPAANEVAKPAAPISLSRLVLHLGGDLASELSPAFEERLEDLRSQLADELGIDLPALGIVPDRLLDEGFFRLDLDGVAIADGVVRVGHVLVNEDRKDLESLGIPFERPNHAQESGGHESWVSGEHRQRLLDAGITASDYTDILLDRIFKALRRYASHFIGVQETRMLLSRIESAYGDLVAEVMRAIPIQKIAEVLRRLLVEDVPIVNMRAILEALATLGDVADPSAATEQVRRALARNISNRFARADRILPVYLLSRTAEEAIASHRPGAFHDNRVQAIVHKLQGRQADPAARSSTAVLVSPEIRPRLRELLIRNEVQLPVLSFAEIAQEFRVQALATVTLTDAEDPAPADGNQRLRLVAG